MSLEFIPEWYYSEKRFSDRWSLLSHACSVLKDGDIAEFGVRNGLTLTHIIKATHGQRKYWGFDSFKGMPSSKYRTSYTKGTLRTPKIPKFNTNNVTIVKGWFSKSLRSHKKYFDKLAMIHIDCDIYESAVLVLNYCHSFIQEGTIIQFDEIHGSRKANPMMHEYRAWQEYIHKFNIEYDVVGVVRKGQAAFEVTKFDSLQDAITKIQ